jgi:hypothetical protein
MKMTSKELNLIIFILELDIKRFEEFNKQPLLPGQEYFLSPDHLDDRVKLLEKFKREVGE